MRRASVVGLTEEQTFKFIEMVHSQECLWNISSTNSSSVLARNQVWSEIGSIFDITGDEAYTKFKSLREKYRRESVKKDSGTKGLSQAKLWPFLNHLRFLDDVYKTRTRCYYLENGSYKMIGSAKELKTSLGATVSDCDEATSTSTFPSFIESESLPPIISNIKEEELSTEMSSPPMLSSAANSPVGSPSPRPSNFTKNRPSIVKHPTQPTSLENTFSQNTDKLISAINNARSLVEPKPFDDVVEFIRQSLINVADDQCEQLQKQLLETCIKFRYQ